MTNDQMKEGRFSRLHNANRKVDFILKHLFVGNTIQLTTYTKAVRYTTKHAAWFKATKSGAYVRSGKSWVCIDYCQINAF